MSQIKGGARRGSKKGSKKGKKAQRGGGCEKGWFPDPMDSTWCLPKECLKNPNQDICKNRVKNTTVQDLEKQRMAREKMLEEALANLKPVSQPVSSPPQNGGKRRGSKKGAKKSSKKGSKGKKGNKKY